MEYINVDMDMKNRHFLSLTSFDSKNEHEFDQLVELMVLIIQSVGLSTLFSSVLKALERRRKTEKNQIVNEAMEEFILLGSSLNEIYFEKVKGQ